MILTDQLKFRFVQSPDIWVVNLDFFRTLIESINIAQKYVYLTAYVINYHPNRHSHPSTKIIDSLILAAQRNLDVRIILDSPKKNSPNYRTNNYSVLKLRKHNISIKTPPYPMTQHSKIWLIDPGLTAISSHNITDSSLRNPFEFACLHTSPLLHQKLLDFYRHLFKNICKNYQVP
ncbi:MAG: hypothetical protein DRJ03_15115 [Chloroflexi bacterium]|nr:MAG: hypothetical protein DRJ03_15115 [Chloroflexota bacterium]